MMVITLKCRHIYIFYKSYGANNYFVLLSCTKN